MRRLLLLVIRLYQLVLSPLLPQACRFYPTCSRYAYAAVERFGFWRGSWLGARRVLRCHPWHPGGFDPVPEARDSKGIWLAAFSQSAPSPAVYSGRGRCVASGDGKVKD